MSIHEKSLHEKIRRQREFADIRSPESESSRYSFKSESPAANYVMDMQHKTYKAAKHGREQFYAGLAKDNGDFRTTLVDDGADMCDPPDETRIDFAKMKDIPHHDHSRFKEDFPINSEYPDTIADKLPCSIFAFADSNKLFQFNTFEELSEYLVNAATRRNCGHDGKFDVFRDLLLRVPVPEIVHDITIGEYLKHLYENDQFMDVVIDVTGEKFLAHRIALSCFSKYFAKLFSESKRRKIPFEVNINGISPQAFAAFIEFCYTGQLNITSNTATDMLILGHYLQVRALKDKDNLSIIGKCLPMDQVMKMLSKLHEQPSKKIYQLLFERLLAEFSEAVLSKSFLEIDVDFFCQLLASDDLVVSSEHEVFTHAVRWIVHDNDVRIKHAMRVMSLVRYCYMTQEQLISCVETATMLRGYEKFRELVLIGNWIITMRKQNRDDPFYFPLQPPRHCYQKHHGRTHTHEEKLHRTEGLYYSIPAKMYEENHARQNENIQNNGICRKKLKSPPIMASTPMDSQRHSIKNGHGQSMAQEQQAAEASLNQYDIFVVGGFLQGQDMIERYHTKYNHWDFVCPLLEPRRHHVVQSLNGFVYLIGGCDPRSNIYSDIILKPTNTVYRLDLKTNLWSEVACLNQARLRHCACIVDGKIYVLGGNGDDNSVLSSAECYDPETDEWSILADMPKGRFAAAAAPVGKRIFVAGGLGEGKEKNTTLTVLKKVICYDTTADSWVRMNDLRFPRCHASLVNIKDRLYLCGGATRFFDAKKASLSSVAAIDRYDANTDEWIKETEMVIPRHDAGVVAAGDFLYIIGGCSTIADRVLRSIECFNTVTGQWLPGIRELPYVARWISCTAIPC